MNHTLDLGGGKTVAILPGGDKAFFYSNSSAEARCIGHLRFDVDTTGKFWSSWWPHQAAQKYNHPPFKDEFDDIVNALQRRVFSKPKQVLNALLDLEIPVIAEERHHYGFHIETAAYSYYFRIFPYPGDYSYCYCYVRGEPNG